MSLEKNSIYCQECPEMLTHSQLRVVACKAYGDSISESSTTATVSSSAWPQRCRTAQASAASETPLRTATTASKEIISGLRYCHRRYWPYVVSTTNDG